MSSPTLSLAIITLNEAKNIQKCIKSVPFASEIIVVDSGSTDETVTIAQNCGAIVIHQPWKGYGRQKQFAIEQAKSDWVLVLDADEWLSYECQEKIKLVIQENLFSGYNIKRKVEFLGKVLNFGKGIDFTSRLFKRGAGQFDSREIHESLKINGNVGVINEPIIHRSSNSINDRLKTINRDVESEIKYMSPTSISRSRMMLEPIKFFLTMYFLKGGFRDGIPGLIWVSLFSFQYFLQIARLYENSIQQSETL